MALKQGRQENESSLIIPNERLMKARKADQKPWRFGMPPMSEEDARRHGRQVREQAIALGRKLQAELGYRASDRLHEAWRVDDQGELGQALRDVVSHARRLGPWAPVELQYAQDFMHNLCLQLIHSESSPPERMLADAGLALACISNEERDLGLIADLAASINHPRLKVELIGDDGAYGRLWSRLYARKAEEKGAD